MATTSLNKNYEYGEVCSPSEISRYIQYVMQYNLSVSSGDIKGEKLVACVWGHAGLSKTSLIKQLEFDGIDIGGKKVYPKVIHVALAQLEEVGDLSGMPFVSKETDSAGVEQATTKYAVPPWWPREDVPTILLIDDFNRADPRILKGIMQVLQDYRSNNADLPPNTHIFLTGNPSGEDYMVNEIDKAILTRMLHVQMKFDKMDWAVWAQKNEVDSRMISFVLKYEELCNGTTGTRTNPRSLVQAARLISRIQDLKNSPLMSVILRSALDDCVVVAFEKFILNELDQLVDPEEILNKFEEASPKLENLSKGKNGKNIRTDLLFVVMDRLYIHIMNEDTKIDDKQSDNFLKLLAQDELIPKDMLYTFLRRMKNDFDNKPVKYTWFVKTLKKGSANILSLIKDVGMTGN